MSASQLSYNSPEFQALFKSNVNIVTIIDKDWKVLDVNRAAPGLKKSDILGKNINDLQSDPKKKEIEKRIISKSFETREENKFETSLIQDDKEIFFITSVSPIVKNDVVVGALLVSQEITDQKQRESQLIQQAHIIEQSSDSIICTDIKGNITHVNQSTLDLYGFTKEEMEGHHVSLIYPPHKRKELEDEIIEALKKNENVRLETERIKKDGSIITIDLLISQIKDDKGEFLCLVGTARDITKDVKKRNEITEIAKLLKETQKAGKVGSWKHDMIRNTTTWSEEVYRIFEVDKKAFNPTYEAFMSFVHKEDREGIEKYFNAHLKENVPFNHTYRILVGENKLKYIQSRGFIIRNESGEVIKSLGTTMDVTKQKLAEQKINQYQNHLEELVDERTAELRKTHKKLITSEQKYKMLVESTSMGITIAVKEKVVFVNDAVVKLLGLDNKDEIIGKSIFQFVTKNAVEAMRERYEKVQNSKTVPNIFESEWLSKDGKEISVKLYFEDIEYEGQKARHASVLDISDLKEKERELKETSQKLKEAMKIKDEFLSVMSHELRTPLNAVIGLSEILFKNIRDSKHRKIAKTLNQSADQLLNLVSNILDYSKIQANKVEKSESVIKLNKFFEELIDVHYMGAIKNNNNLFYTFRGEMPKYVLSDEIKLRQIFNNLLSNAIKFTENGQVTIKVSHNTKMEPNMIDRAYLTFDVEDTGQGISDEDIEHIFTPFEQTHAGLRQGGTGLGLSIVNDLVKILDGKIEVKSQLNTGTTFSITLPFLIPENTAISEVEQVQKKDKLGLKNKRILYVEDVQTNQFLIKTLLEENGINCSIAADGIKAIKALEEDHVDLILMDIQLPDINGFELSDLIKSKNAHLHNIPIIGFTADLSAQVQGRIKNSSLDDCLTKPLDSKKLFHVLNKYLVNISFDFSYYKELFNNDEDKLSKFFQLFKVDLLEFNKNLNHLVKERNLSEIQKELHKMSSSIKNLKNNRLNQLLESIRGAEKFDKNIKNELSEVESTLRKLVKVIDREV